MFLWWPPQYCSIHDYLLKNMVTRDRGIFSLYIYVENFKNLLYRNHWTDFNITWQNCFLGNPLPRLFKSSWFVKKTWQLEGGVGWGQEGGLFSLYIYIEKFKNHLVRNHWTYFNITWWKCSFDDPLLSLFKPSWFVKKHSCKGAWLIFLIYQYRKL